MPLLIPIPLTYSALSDAYRRAENNWGSRQAIARILGLLQGGLPSWQVDRHGRLDAIPTKFWSDPRSVRILDGDGTYELEPRKSDAWRLVFREADLDQHLPWTWQRTAARRGKPISQAPSSVSPKVEEAALPEKAPSRKRGSGRPPNPDGEYLIMEAARLAVAGDFGPYSGKTQDQFVEAMIAWKNMHMATKYEDGTVEVKIKAFWRHVWGKKA